MKDIRIITAVIFVLSLFVLPFNNPVSQMIVMILLASFCMTFIWKE